MRLCFAGFIAHTGDNSPPQRLLLEFGGGARGTRGYNSLLAEEAIGGDLTTFRIATNKERWEASVKKAEEFHGRMEVGMQWSMDVWGM